MDNSRLLILAEGDAIALRFTFDASKKAVASFSAAPCSTIAVDETL